MRGDRARAAADRRPDRTGVWFRRRRVPGRLGPLGVTRLVAVQVAQVGAVAAVVQPVGWVRLGGVVAGALTTVVALGRWRGRWWTDLVALRLDLRRRRGRVAVTADDPRLASLCQLVPDLTVEDVEATDGAKLGMGSDGAGWFVVLEVDTAEAAIHPPVPLAALARIATEAEQAGVVIQVVWHSVPVAADAPEPPGPSAQPDPDQIGRQRTLWVAVRLDADAVADSAVDNPDGDRHLDVPAVLGELSRRVGRVLRRRGLPSRVLDSSALLDALGRSCDLTPGDDFAGQESWDGWHSVRLVHRGYWLRRWPDPERGTGLLASLGDLPGASVSIAVTLEPRAEGEGTDLRCLVRLATEPHRNGPVAARAERLARRFGGRLFPLDGEHPLAVYATAPSGGGAR